MAVEVGMAGTVGTVYGTVGRGVIDGMVDGMVGRAVMDGMGIATHGISFTSTYEFRSSILPITTLMDTTNFIIILLINILRTIRIERTHT